jgi:hypothetical protein
MHDPWQMTRAEWIAYNEATWIPDNPYLADWYKNRLRANGFDHRPAVALAMDLGKPVSKHVLADYPEISEERL